MDVVSHYLRDLRARNEGLLLSNDGIRIATDSDAEYVKSLINAWNNRSPVLMNIRGYGVEEPMQQFDYIKSNLKGYIFYFICKDCGRSAKYLYLPVGGDRFLCRNCHGLKYPRKYKHL
jgi:hypothetical protein